MGKRFAQYVVVDGEFATAPFLHTAGELGLWVVARLKDNLPELFAAAQQRFPCGPPSTVFEHGPDRVELWDAQDFDRLETLDWETVHVFFYRQHKPDSTVVEALTNIPFSTVGPQALFRLAKSRWEIDNQGFHDAKSRHGLEHICHHHANSLLIGWLLTMLALTIERLYRLRYFRLANIACPAVPNCCSTCGPVFPARVPPIAVEARQKNRVFPFCKSDHAATPNRDRGCNTQGRDLSENGLPSLHSALEQKPALNPGSFPWRL